MARVGFVSPRSRRRTNSVATPAAEASCAGVSSTRCRAARTAAPSAAARSSLRAARRPPPPARADGAGAALGSQRRHSRLPWAWSASSAFAGCNPRGSGPQRRSSSSCCRRCSSSAVEPSDKELIRVHLASGRRETGLESLNSAEPALKAGRLSTTACGGHAAPCLHVASLAQQCPGQAGLVVMSKHERHGAPVHALAVPRQRAAPLLLHLQSVGWVTRRSPSRPSEGQLAPYGCRPAERSGGEECASATSSRGPRRRRASAEAEPTGGSSRTCRPVRRSTPTRSVLVGLSKAVARRRPRRHRTGRRAVSAEAAH